jgi:hypothetical protein
LIREHLVHLPVSIPDDTDYTVSRSYSNCDYFNILGKARFRISTGFRYSNKTLTLACREIEVSTVNLYSHYDESARYISTRLSAACNAGTVIIASGKGATDTWLSAVYHKAIS